jgi:SNF2 family DNA or RNA helicase
LNPKYQKKVLHEYPEDLPKNYSLDDVPKIFSDRLFPFQKDGVKFAIENYGRFILGDEMGVGKTIQALAICCVYKEDWPVIIICPSSLRYNWRDEILKWMPWIRMGDIHLITMGKENIRNHCKIYIISYELSVKICD